MLKQNLSQRHLQKLSPQQIQLMKLLQIPTATFDQRIQEEIEANPALEEGDEVLDAQIERDTFSATDDLSGSDSSDNKGKDGDSAESKEEAQEKTDDIELDEYLTDYIDDDTANYKLKSDNYSNPDDDNKVIPIALESSFHEFLEQQLGLKTFKSEEDEKIALQILGSIDEDGYLRREPIALLDDLAFSANIMTTEENILSIIKIIQTFDPPGVGASNLQECLQIQMVRRIREAANDDPFLEDMHNAEKILNKYFDEFTKKHYPKLQRQLSVDSEGLKAAIEQILKLNPKPGSAFTSKSTVAQYIVPDFTISNTDGELELTLNSRNAPDLRISDHFRDMLQTYEKGRGKKRKKSEKEAVMFIKQKIDSAKWFIDAIRQRQQTMYKTMYAILQFQYDFFLSGSQKDLRPMILKDIAELTGLDISTVSRVANSKYVMTEFGTKKLKSFFSESLQTSDGQEVSTFEVKKILSELIEAENKRKPLSDEKLKNLLQDKQYNIARRTVAKYREQLNIPVARLRKEL